MNHTGRIAHPYILLITDGNPISDDNYDSELKALLENGWFTNSQRFAVLIGDAIKSTNTRNAVSKFVSNTEEGIIELDKIESVLNYYRPIHIGPRVQNFPISNNHVEDYKDATASVNDFGGFGGFDGDFGNDSFI